MKYYKKLCILSLFLINIGITITFATGTNDIIGIHNINHTITDKTVHFTWDATSGNNQADMFIWTPKTQVFRLINTIDVFKKQASLQINENGNYVVRFIPLGGGNDIRYSFFISGLNIGKKDINIVPKTGIKENILLILSLSIFLYIIYRWKKTLKNK